MSMLSLTWPDLDSVEFSRVDEGARLVGEVKLGCERTSDTTSDSVLTKSSVSAITSSGSTVVVIRRLIRQLIKE